MSPRPLAAAAAFLCLAGCFLFYRSIQPAWVDADVHSRSESLMYEVVHLSLQRAHYPVGLGADKRGRRIVSGWLYSESPFKGKGYRQKATVTYEPGPDATFLVHCRVQRETNESFRPLDPRYAEWKEAEDNPTEAVRILQYVRSYLSSEEGFEVGPGR